MDFGLGLDGGVGGVVVGGGDLREREEIGDDGARFEDDDIAVLRCCG